MGAESRLRTSDCESVGLGVNVEPCPEYERAEWGRNLHLEDCCLNCRRLEGCGVLVARLESKRAAEKSVMPERYTWRREISPGVL